MVAKPPPPIHIGLLSSTATFQEQIWGMRKGEEGRTTMVMAVSVVTGYFESLLAGSSHSMHDFCVPYCLPKAWVGGCPEDIDLRT